MICTLGLRLQQSTGGAASAMLDRTPDARIRQEHNNNASKLSAQPFERL